VDVADFDVRRFAAAQANERYLLARAPESLARLYTMHWPFLQPESARGLRRVPLYDRLAAAAPASARRPAGSAPTGSAARHRAHLPVLLRQAELVCGGSEEHRAARESVAHFRLWCSWPVPEGVFMAHELVLGVLASAEGLVSYEIEFTMSDDSICAAAKRLQVGL